MPPLDTFVIGMDAIIYSDICSCPRLQEGRAIPACALVTITGRHTSSLPVFTVQDTLIGTLPFDPASGQGGGSPSPRQ